MRQRESTTANRKHAIAPSKVGPPQELSRYTRHDGKVVSCWLLPAQPKSFVVWHLDGQVEDMSCGSGVVGTT